MIAWLKCLWRGHQIKAWPAFEHGKRPVHYVYACTRCRRLLPGPRS